MHNLSALLVVICCSGCQLQTFDIPKAPLKPNQAVIFDIDGTLTPKPWFYNTARDDSTAAVQLYAASGYKIIYLSARRRMFQSGIPGWLTKNKFPEGSIQVPQTSIDGSDHAAFKTRILNEFAENGWSFVAAYGDSTTDFEAYSAVGIDKDHIFALRRVGKDTCQQGVWAECLDSWTDHLANIDEIVQR